MAAHLTDKQKKKIIADYVEIGSYNAVAKKHKVSATTVKNLVKKDAESVEKCEQKKEENTADVLAYMESRKNDVCKIIGIGLELLPEKLKEANATQITTAIGTLIDKFTMARAQRGVNDIEDDPLTKALMEEAERLNNADIE